MLTTISRSLGIAWRHRPGLVVTTGSGLVVSFCLAARALGARLIFLETAARVRSPSRAGLVLSRAANRTVVQWQPMLSIYPGSVLALPSVLESVRNLPETPGQGTFLGVGMHPYPFDRLIQQVDDAVGRRILPQPVVAQVGPSAYRPRHFEADAWMPPSAIEQAIKTSRYIVTHGGTGLISAALRVGRRPLVLPRSGDLREHFDNHQEELVSALHELDLIVPVEEGIDAAAVQAVDGPLPSPGQRLAAPTLQEVLRREISRYL